MFSMISNHNIIDFVKEIYLDKSHKINHSVNYFSLILPLIYLLIGSVCYIKFGFEMNNKIYENVLFAFNFHDSNQIICNFLIVTFLSLNNILKYKPTKDICTLLLRKRYRDSKLWNALVITLVHILHFTFCWLLINNGNWIDTLITFVGITGPISNFIFPLIAFHRIYYYDKRYDKMRYFNYVMLFTAIFLTISEIIFIIVAKFNDRDPFYISYT